MEYKSKGEKGQIKISIFLARGKNPFKEPTGRITNERIGALGEGTLATIVRKKRGGGKKERNACPRT